jgi:hypothetical protein
MVVVVVVAGAQESPAAVQVRSAVVVLLAPVAAVLVEVGRLSGVQREGLQVEQSCFWF